MDDSLVITSGLPHPNMREQVVDLFYEAFTQKVHHLELFTPDKEKAIRIMMHSVDTNSAIYALHQGRVVGVLGIKWADGRNFMRFRFATLRHEFGLWGATWRYLWQTFERRITKIPDNTMNVRGIAVHHTMRGRGVGTLLLDALEKRAHEEGFTRLSLEVVDTNPEARRLYERLGFRVIKRESLGWLTKSAGFTAVDFMAKPLSS